jgi:Histidine kinase-, DNA gyrase B-, and HSP90-like ATPase
MADPQKRTLELRFHGRIVDHLAAQTYQSPISAIAEMVANAWDADAGEVVITLPAALGGQAVLIVQDDGVGMTCEEVQDRYLAVGINRRDDDPTKQTDRGRPLMGRKGIGKFAGFGIANRMTIDTVSKETGERTRFVLDFDRIRGESDEYVDEEPTDIPDVEWWPADEHEAPIGTRIELSDLKLKVRPAASSMRRSLARRFLLLERADEFKVTLDGEAISDEGEESGVQFKYPEEWAEDDRPDGLTVTDDGWGEEEVNGHVVRWRCVFYNDTIKDEELRGFSVFAHNKLAQKPFFFDFTGGTEGQQGQEYLSGQVEASFLDDEDDDLVSIERQRVDWNHPTAAPLLEWGQGRLKRLLSLWNARRVADKMRQIKDKVGRFEPRLEKLPTHERKIVEGALQKLAGIKSLTNEQFVTLSEATLTAWEGGRLKELIAEVADAGSMDEAALLSILTEHQVLTALHTLESVTVKKQVVDGLRQRIENGELENAVRDYIGENPWLIEPKWETYRVEKSLGKIVEEEAKKRFSKEMLDKRLDLVLASGPQLLVLEFMKPGLTLDGDHLSRFELYINALRSNVETNTGDDFKYVTGIIVADRIDKDAALRKKIQDMEGDQKFALEWDRLLQRAGKHWAEFFDALVERTPNDPRVAELRAAAEPNAQAEANGDEDAGSDDDAEEPQAA